MINRFRIFGSMIAAAVILAIMTTSCSSVNMSLTKLKTGPAQTVDVQVPLPGQPSNGAELNLEFVAGQMKLAPGATEYLAEGTAIFNAAELEPKVESNGSSFTLRQGDGKIKGISNFKEVQNEWDLQLANKPLSLSIKAGAYTGSFELGGLSLNKLAIEEGGSDLTGTFSKPNNVVMTSFAFDTGGSKMLLKGLANANFEQMIFKSGAGDYTLSFDGDLQRDARVSIETGASTINIIVPEGVNSQVTFNGGLSSVQAGGGWSKNGSVYSHPGKGPTITIDVQMGVGTLNLKNE